MAPSGKKSATKAATKAVATPAVSAKPDVIAAAMTPLPHDETAVTPAITAKAEKIAKEMTAKGKKPAAVKAPAAAPAETPAPKKAAPKKKPAAVAAEPAGEAAETEEAVPATRRPMSAYNKFIKYRLSEMKTDADYAEMAHKDKFKAAGEEWKSLSDEEKADILERAEAYIAELNEPAKPPRKKRVAKAAKAASKAGSEEEAPAAPVKKEKRHRAPTTYNFFMAHRIHELTESHPELTHRERFTMSAAEWKTLEGEDKENAVAEAMRYHEQKEAEEAAAAAATEA